VVSSSVYLVLVLVILRSLWANIQIENRNLISSSDLFVNIAADSVYPSHSGVLIIAVPQTRVNKDEEPYCIGMGMQFTEKYEDSEGKSLICQIGHRITT